MAAHLCGGYCYVCGADVRPDDLRECAACGSPACEECRRDGEDGDATCVACLEGDSKGEEGER